MEQYSSRAGEHEDGHLTLPGNSGIEGREAHGSERLSNLLKAT